MTTISWVAPDGSQLIVLKDDGQGLMITAFQFWVGDKWWRPEKNKWEQERKALFGWKSSKGRNGDRWKKDLLLRPFVVEFEYGANYEGHWCYEHPVLQLEDCVDCFKVISSQFKFLFMFDHSCGHDWQREDGLNVENMSKNLGGKQTFMHDT